MNIPMPEGEVQIGNEAVGRNGIRVRSNTPDPAEVVLESISGAGGKFAGAEARSDGNREEFVLVQFKKDERTRGTGELSGEITVHIRDGRITDPNACWIKVFEVRLSLIHI